MSGNWIGLFAFSRLCANQIVSEGGHLGCSPFGFVISYVQRPICPYNIKEPLPSCQFIFHADYLLNWESRGQCLGQMMPEMPPSHPPSRFNTLSLSLFLSLFLSLSLSFSLSFSLSLSLSLRPPEIDWMRPPLDGVSTYYLYGNPHSSISLTNPLML